MGQTTYKTRLQDIQRFYNILKMLEEIQGGYRTLDESSGQMDWPERGVYFFFEGGENRSNSGQGHRVTRVGTHALIEGSSSTLWKRLRMHRGTLRGGRPGGGNHRGSVFRHHVGTALKARDDWSEKVAGEWEEGSSAPASVRDAEYPLEQAVSDYIRQMPFLWLGIGDAPGPDSLRGYIEENTIALLSNYGADQPIDPPAEDWLGRWAASDEIEASGLWNVNHVNKEYDPDFLTILEDLVSEKTNNKKSIRSERRTTGPEPKNDLINHPRKTEGSDLDDLKHKIKSFICERDWEQFHAPKNLAVALSVEASELLEIFQWKENDEELTEKEQQALSHEIGDVLIYLLELADKFDIDPLQAAHHKLERNKKKYPADQVRGKAEKYTDYT